MRSRYPPAVDPAPAPVRHLLGVDWKPNRTHPPDPAAWPFTIPAVAQLAGEGGLDIGPGVTFLVGENGSGKSTLVEALAAVYPRHGHEASFFGVTGAVESDEDSPLRWLRGRVRRRSSRTATRCGRSRRTGSSSRARRRSPTTPG